MYFLLIVQELMLLYFTSELRFLLDASSTHK